MPADGSQSGRHFLTAAVVDPTAFTGELNAAPCDIGIYVHGSVSSTIAAADIHGAHYYGVAVNGSSASATISSSQVWHIGDDPHNGSQHGVGIYYTAGATGSVDSTHIFDFQKNGTVFSGDGTHVDITNSEVNGDGPVSFIAQNGIQYSGHSSGSARVNLVTDIFYTGCSQQDAQKTGCVPFVAVGILLFDVDANAVDTSRNFYRDDQRDLILITSASLGD